jgi:hypothetical protein
VTEVGPGTLPIGRPIGNARIYILDRKGRPAPIGVEGEIHIAGAGVGEGYLGEPERTEEVFVRDPFAGGRMYRTGDVGRWRADGNIEFVGRNDEQVKLRGFRIEPGEIAARLSEHEGVKEAVVLARGDGGETRLVAYVVPGEAKPQWDELREHLKQRLPEYMVPSAWVELEALPLTANGKVDRKALPEPDGEAHARRGYEAPQGEVETALAAIWSELLGVERVGRNDNFFELGGHSLLAVQLIERMKIHRLRTDVVTVFKSETLAVLAALTRKVREVRV